MHSDQLPNFDSFVLKGLYTVLGFEKTLTVGVKKSICGCKCVDMILYLQSDDIVERFYRNIMKETPFLSEKPTKLGLKFTSAPVCTP